MFWFKKKKDEIIKYVKYFDLVLHFNNREYIYWKFKNRGNAEINKNKIIKLVNTGKMFTIKIKDTDYFINPINVLSIKISEGIEEEVK
jgi:hypothetical protein